MQVSIRKYYNLRKRDLHEKHCNFPASETQAQI